MENSTIKEFNYKGFDCLIKRIGFSNTSKDLLEEISITGSNDLSMRQWWLCGYVILPSDHPLNGKRHDDLSDVINVHGDFTYSNDGKNNTWIIGFDCNHLHDGDKENTEEFVVFEIQSVVDQITDLENDLRYNKRG